jgi:hypothetical protein
VRVVWTQTALRGTWRAYEYLMDSTRGRLCISLNRCSRQPGGFFASWPAGARHEHARAGDGQSIIRYRVTADTVIILRVRHRSRRPTKP